MSGRIAPAFHAVLHRRALVALAAVGAILVAAASASAAPKATVFAKAVDNPRGLALGPDGTLYVASAGHAGPTCFDKKQEDCVGLTSRVLAYSPAGAKRVVAKGLISGGGGDGSFAAGADGVSIGPTATSTRSRRPGRRRTSRRHPRSSRLAPASSSTSRWAR